MSTDQAIRHELAIICRAYGFTGDPTSFLSHSPDWIAQGLRSLGVDGLTLGIVSSWGDTLDDEEVLSMLKDINDMGDI